MPRPRNSPKPRDWASMAGRVIRIGLGSLWLLDGLLQLQPRMFSPDFANDVIAAAAQGQPLIVSWPMNLFIKVFLLQPLLFNSLVVAVQVMLGILILYKSTSNLGLKLSIFWGLFVWFVGEGFAGLLSGHAILLMGAPGAALIYVLLALALLSLGKTNRFPSWLLIAWAVIWIGGAIYQVLPGQNTVEDVGMMVSGNSNGAPTWLAQVQEDVGADIFNIGLHFESMTAPMTPAEMADMAKVPGSGLWFILILAALQASIGGLIFLPGWPRILALSLGVFLSLAFWVLGQSLGGFYTGLGTDPNSGPLFVLLAVAVAGFGVGVKFKIGRELT